MGGGDARVGTGSVICRVRRAPPNSVDIVETAPLGTEMKTVRVRNPSCPPGTPEAQAIRQFFVSPGGALEHSAEHIAEPDEAAVHLFDTAGSSALEWLLSGFSSSVIAMGEAGSGKSHALFGPRDAAVPERYGLCPRLVSELFDAIDVSRTDLTLSIACWDVRHDAVVDLLASGGPDGQQAQAAAAAGGPHPFVLVHAPSRSEAKRILELARSRSRAASLPASSSPAAAIADGFPPPPPPSRASLFIRFVLHDASRRSVASLYLVDLVGTAPLPTAAEASESAAAAAAASSSASASASSAGAVTAERRGLNRQISAFHRLLSEVGGLDASHGPPTLEHLVGSRDSKLTQQIAPLLIGNCKTHLLACVHAEASHYGETCATLRAASHVLSLQAPCLRLPNVSLSDVPMVQPQAVLPPEVPLRRAVAAPQQTATVPRRRFPQPPEGVRPLPRSGGGGGGDGGGGGFGGGGGGGDGDWSFGWESEYDQEGDEDGEEVEEAAAATGGAAADDDEDEDFAAQDAALSAAARSIAQQVQRDLTSAGMKPGALVPEVGKVGGHGGRLGGTAAAVARGGATAAACAPRRAATRLRGAGRNSDSSNKSPQPTGSVTGGNLKAELQGMMAQLGRSPGGAGKRSPGGAAGGGRGGSSGPGAPPVEAWVTRELERRVQEELAIARGQRGVGAFSRGERSAGAGTQSSPERSGSSPQRSPAVIVSEHESASTVRSYAAQHAATANLSSATRKHLVRGHSDVAPLERPAGTSWLPPPTPLERARVSASPPDSASGPYPFSCAAAPKDGQGGGGGQGGRSASGSPARSPTRSSHLASPTKSAVPSPGRPSAIPSPTKSSAKSPARSLYTAAREAEAEAAQLEAAQFSARVGGGGDDGEGGVGAAGSARPQGLVDKEAAAAAEVVTQAHADAQARAAVRASTERSYAEFAEQQARMQAMANQAEARSQEEAASGGYSGGGGSAGATADADGLEGNYETVLSLLKEADESRQAERARTDEAEREALEQSTVHELQLAELQEANLELRKRLRRLEASSSHAAAFELYEAEIDSLTSRLHAAQAENAELEEHCREASMAYEVARDAARTGLGDDFTGYISATMEAKLGRVRTYKRTLAATEREVKELRAKAADNDKKVRQAEVNKRSADDATKRLQKLSSEHAKVVAELTSARLTVSNVQAHHDEMMARIRSAQAEAEAAVAHAQAKSDESDELREQIAKLQFERRKDAVVLRMAPRLQSSAEKLRQHLLGRSRERSTPRALPGRGPGSNASAAELLAQLERELSVVGKSNKAMILLGKARTAVDSLELARQDGAEREDELLQLLVENLAPEDGGNHANYVGNANFVPGDRASPPRREGYAAATPIETRASSARGSGATSSRRSAMSS